MNVINEIFPIKEVTVYPNAARIKRVQRITLKKGENELIIRGLPRIITEESVRIEAKNSHQVKILDIISRDYFIEHYDENRYRVEMKKLEEIILKQARLEAQFRNYNDEFLLFLNKENLSGADIEELHRTIAVKNWDEFFLFVRKTLSENRNSVRDLLFQWITLQKEIETGRKNLEELTSYEKMKEHEIIAHLSAAKELEEEFHILYLQPGVAWHPAYTLRADTVNKLISINLFGMISQTTGEDWENIKVVLSTAIPMHNLNIPEVKSKRIKERDTSIIMNQPVTAACKVVDGLFDKSEDMDMDMETTIDTDDMLYAEEKKDSKKMRSSMVKKIMRSKTEVANKKKPGMKGSVAGGLSTGFDITTSPGNISPKEKPKLERKDFAPVQEQGIENLVKEVDRKVLPPFSLAVLSDYYKALYNHLGDRFTPEDSIPPAKTMRSNAFFVKGVSLVQSVGGFDYRYHVASTQKIIPSSSVPVQVSVDIKELPVELVYITVPLEKEIVYLKAVFSNEYDNPFPAGPAQVFVENNFLGNINFPTLGINEGTFISLGVERDIKVLRKEKIVRKTGGVVKKGVTVCYTVEIELISYKPDDVLIEVLDRVPLSSNAAEITITDTTYNPKPQIVTDRNIILWKVTLLPRKKKVVSFSYSIKHPEDFRLTMQLGNHPYLGK
ncbi:MAG: mucoidy inhibitor MuiA family protein [Spirochaetales bacterium]|nr:mucoidy inhibitor MuiA family protein [Spirochaetales bacterium]